jgi:hypothetical protein
VTSITNSLTVLKIQKKKKKNDPSAALTKFREFMISVAFPSLTKIYKCRKIKKDLPKVFHHVRSWSTVFK